LHNLAFGNVVVHSENGKFVVTIHRRSFRLSGNDLKHHLRGSFRYRHITRQGKEGVVMISDEEYERLRRRQSPSAEKSVAVLSRIATGRC
jgi:PHD/YefM family antitoxin component YafN of YafNO toxin-antitoxin module